MARRSGKSKAAGGGSPATGAPDRLVLWTIQHRTLTLGLLAAALGVAAGAWATLASAPLEAARETAISWLGGGVYLAAGLVTATGALIVWRRWRPEQGKLGEDGWRRIGGIAALLAAAWGIAGAFSPEVRLGGVSLADESAGGQIGAALASPLGWIAVAALLIGAAGALAPGPMAAGLRYLGRKLRDAGGVVRRNGPGALGWVASHVWVGLAALGRGLWGGIKLFGREIGVAAAFLWQEWRESRARRRAEQQAAAARAAAEAAAMSRAMQAAPAAPIEAAPPPLFEPVVAEPEPSAPEPVETPVAVGTPPEPESEPEPNPLADEPPPARRTLDRTDDAGWRLPPLELLDPDPADTVRGGAEASAKIIVDTLASFGVDAAVTQINEGPSVTQFGIEPGWEVKTRTVAVKGADGKAVLDDQGRPVVREEEVSRTRVRVNRITRLADDLALALAAPSIRVEAPVPGQPIIGLEVPNEETRVVSLRGLLESPEYQAMVQKGGLPIALGRDVRGNAVVTDLAKMPHVLIAGATGSGKSVCINTIICCLLMYQSPEKLRLILVDPKRVELTSYGAAPHLAFSHVVTEPDEVVGVLGVVVAEMERRYKRLETCGARNLAAYNALPTTVRQMPYWVVVLDELADMMMAAPVDVEQQIVRLAQLARAVGIHLVVATQRPSVDVVTGLIKANFPSRIAFATTSQTDARVIMDRAGAEKLLGRGDMLLMTSDSIKARRVQGAYVSDAEIERLIEAWSPPTAAEEEERPTLDEMLGELSEESPSAQMELQARASEAELSTLESTLETALAADADDDETEEDEEEEPDIVLEEEPPAAPQESQLQAEAASDTRLAEAEELARDYERVSASLLQRRMRIGQPRAERLIDALEQRGVVAESEGGPSRRVLVRTS